MTTEVLVMPIEKEELPGLVFQKKEVLDSRQQQQKRKNDLYKAMVLGNNNKTKVKIIFETYNGHLMQVETTIWMASDTNVILKGGVTIPVNAIREVRFL